MTAWLSRLIGGIRALFGRARAEQDLDAELRDFLERSVEQQMDRGLDRDAAVRAARRDAGSLDAIKDYVRDVGWESVVESAWQDLRYAVRQLRKSPGFTSVAVLTLGLGIGSTTAVFSLLDAVLLRSLPVNRPQELVLVGGSQYPVFQAFSRHTELFENLLATSGVTPLDVESQPGVHETTGVSLVSGSYFSTLRVQPVIGRVFTASEDAVTAEHPVAVASFAYWRRHFGDEAALGPRLIRISGTPITVVGVAPPDFFGENVGLAPDLWVPLTMWGRIVPGPDPLANPGRGWLRLIGRVKPGVATTGVQPALTATFQRVVGEIFGPRMPPDVQRDTARASIAFEPAATGLSSLRLQFARPLQVMMGAVAGVLLIVCANVAGLLLARATARRREIDLRLALGVGRGRLLRQLLTESAVLAAAGSVIGVGLAWAGQEALLRLISADGSRLALSATLDVRLLAFVAATALATAMLFGLAPAWQSARPRLSASLLARRTTAGPSRQRLRSLLVVAQVALSLVLLAGAGLFLRTLANLHRVNLGFDAARLIAIELNLEAAGYRGDRASEFSRELLQAMKSVPGISSATLSEHGILTGIDNGTNLMRPEGAVEGPDGFPRTRWEVVGPNYFSTLGATLLAGRDFSDRDDARSRPVTAINEDFARLFFGDANPIGRRLVWGAPGSEKTLEVIAVARGARQAGPRAEPQPSFYLPYLQLPLVRPTWALPKLTFVARTAASPAATAPALRQLAHARDSRLSVASLEVGDVLLGRTLVRERTVATLLITFGALAVGLACLGLYGLIAYEVIQRTPEIGIRLALGAQRADVLWSTLKRALVWTAAGIATGVPLAIAGATAAETLLFGLDATDAGTLLGAAGAMAAIGLVAAYLPARRASRADPLVAFRE